MLIQKSRCYYCGCNLTAYTKDHKIPVSSGIANSNTIENIVLACRRCNIQKGVKDADKYIKTLKNKLSISENDELNELRLVVDKSIRFYLKKGYWPDLKI